ncbi:YqeG family HAD IIIA-type phosphatase [Lysinibacillus telephonicus]|uniref:YqeG family HAD IIIA-type phosphatase n=1 Tax=Lysinibacillus telephonicus TaxID=1714840 RepID=A0A431UWM2_9BACI|nr:YqeG family HAD IIIA-type phosphatase [Lysinibacillus telephonicus]RTQ95639.1 YqeG family HAD IIIA-type phosphatase [Lysinibacillus telephonicus]
MYNFLLPNEFVTTVFEITPEKLEKLGVRGIITDLDNTLIEWDRPDATEEIATWMKELEDAGLKIIIVSNNNDERVKRFADPLGIPFISRARKPLGAAYYAAMKQLRLKSNEVVMVGDQLLTDIMGANRLNLYTFLVRPVAESDGFVTRFNRFVERRVFNLLKRKGIKTWEEQ